MTEVINGRNITGNIGSLDDQVYIECHFENISFPSEVINTKFIDCTFASTSAEHTKFQNISWNSCAFKECDFQHSSIVGSTFVDCDLSGTKFSFSRWDTASVMSSTLFDTVWDHAYLKTGGWDSCHCDDIHGDATIFREWGLSGLQVRGWSLRNPQFINAEFVGSKMTDQVIDGWQLLKCNFSRSSLSGVDFSIATLSGCLFAESILNSCDFKHSQLPGINFSNSRAKYCDFENSYCNSSVFFGAELDHCNFSKTTLQGSTFGDSIISDSVFSESDCANVDFSHSILVRVNFNRANLKNARFHGSAYPSLHGYSGPTSWLADDSELLMHERYKPRERSNN